MSEWNSYIDEYGAEAEYESNENWEVRMNDDSLEIFENKEDALSFLFDEIDELTNNVLYDNIGLFGFNDYDDMFYSFLDMCSSDFYENLYDILEHFDIEEKFKLVNLDNDEPEFGEL